MLESENMPVKPNLTSKFWKTLFTLLAVSLVFIGPTYVVYLLGNILKIDYGISMLSGGALFIAGLILLWYLIKNKVIS